MEGQQRQDGRRGSSRSRKAEKYINKVDMAFAEGHHQRSNNILLLASKNLRDPRIKSRYPTLLLLG